MGRTEIKDNIVVSYNQGNFNFEIEQRDNLIYKTNLRTMH